MKSQEKVLVLDGDSRAALAVVRSLGSQGLRVIVGSDGEKPLAGASRYCDHTVRYSSPEGPDLFCESLITIIKKERPDVLMPITDMTVFAVLNKSSILRDLVSIPFVDIKEYWAASDKCELIKLAKNIGVECPKTWFIQSPANVEQFSPEFEFPIILKPHASLLISKDHVQKTSVRVVYDKTELDTILKNDDTIRIPYMVQEMVEGEGLGIFAVCKNGEPLAVFSHKRIREKPPWGGVSVLCESTIPDLKAKENAYKLLKELNWTGVAMVEFKRDDRSGLPMLMEINARFWGSLQLAIDAGVDFPYLLYLQSKGKEIPKLDTYRKVRSRWLLGDLDNLIITMKMPKGKTTIFGKLTAIFNFFVEFFKASRIEETRYIDIGVLMRAIAQWVKSYFTKA